MNILVIPEIKPGSTFPPSTTFFAQYDQVLTCDPEVRGRGNATIQSIRPETMGCIAVRDEIDVKTTAFARNLLYNGDRLSIDESELFRVAALYDFQAQWVGQWPLMEQTLTSLCAGAPHCVHTIEAEWPIFSALLKHFCVQNDLAYRPLLPELPAPSARRFNLIWWKRHALKKGRQMTRRAVKMASRLRAMHALRSMPIHKPRLVIFVGEPTHLVILQDAVQRLALQYDISFVAYTASTALVDACAPYPLWDLSTLRSGQSFFNRSPVLYDLDTSGIPEDAWLCRCKAALLSRLQTRYFPSIQRGVNSLAWVLKWIKPAVVGSTINDSAIAFAARLHGIPSINVAHAEHGAYGRVYGYDRVALFGQRNVERHRTVEVPPDTCELLPVGPCRYDTIVRGEYTDSSIMRTQLGLKEHQRVVVFPSFWSIKQWVDSRPRLLQWIAEALPVDAVLVVKLHPLECDQVCEQYLSSNMEPARYRLVQEIDLYGLLSIADVVVLSHSSVGAEAIVQGRPVVITVWSPDAHWQPYVEYGVSALVHDGIELKSTLNNALTIRHACIPDYARKRRHYLKQCLAGADGNASARLAELITEMAT